MCLEAVSEEELRRIWHKDGYTEGIDAGRSEKAIEDARSFYANGASIELIAKSLNMTIEQVKEIVNEKLPVETVQA